MRHENQERILDRARAAGFTPGRRDIAPLLDAMLTAEEDRDVRAAERALARRGDLSLPAALARLDGARGADAGALRSRTRLVRLVGRLAASPDQSPSEAALAGAMTAVVEALTDPEPRIRRQAALALARASGGGGGREAESASSAGTAGAPATTNGVAASTATGRGRVDADGSAGATAGATPTATPTAVAGATPTATPTANAHGRARAGRGASPNASADTNASADANANTSTDAKTNDGPGAKASAKERAIAGARATAPGGTTPGPNTSAARARATANGRDPTASMNGRAAANQDAAARSRASQDGTATTKASQDSAARSRASQDATAGTAATKRANQAAPPGDQSAATAGATVEDALLAAWQREADVSVRRALAAALGQSGERALAALRASPPSPDAELRRLVERAALTASRTLERGRSSVIDAGTSPGSPLPLVLRCRAGLERLLAAEIAAAGWPVVASGPGRVETVLSRPLSSVFHFRLHHGAAFPLSARPGPTRRAVVDALTSPEADAVIGAFTRGAVRFRLEWEHGGHRRADVWRIAGDIAARRPDLVNDPTDSTWRVHVIEDGSSVRVALEPRKIDDPRFAYRVADVPAASHPTVAAALARLAVTHSAAPADDVVWDPFVGSGLELCERARLGPSRRLVGTDISTEALAAARANLDAAGVHAALSIADALTHDLAGVTLILTNPPMGKRVLRGRAHAVLESMIERAASLLPAGGLLCWISPIPGQTRARAAAVGLRLIDAYPIDLGGFAAEVQVLRREERRAARGPARDKARDKTQDKTRDRGPRPPAGSRGGARRSRPARSA